MLSWRCVMSWVQTTNLEKENGTETNHAGRIGSLEKKLVRSTRHLNFNRFDQNIVFLSLKVLTFRPAVYISHALALLRLSVNL